MVPELAVLLDVEPEPTDAEARLVRGAVDVAVAVASSGRPLVIAVDDLQWAGTTAIAFIDALVTDQRQHAVLLVGAYRDGEVDALHPLTARLSEWERLGLAPLAISLVNLPPADVGRLLGDMLRLDDDAATRDLAEVVAERTGGNPFDTVELVNALRRDEVIGLGDDGWSWDRDAIRRYIGQGDVVDLLANRITALPAATVDLLGVLADLGGQVDLALLATAADLSPEAVGRTAGAGAGGRAPDDRRRR